MVIDEKRGHDAFFRKTVRTLNVIPVFFNRLFSQLHYLTFGADIGLLRCRDGAIPCGSFRKVNGGGGRRHINAHRECCFDLFASRHQ